MPGPLRILHLEDRARDAGLVHAMLVLDWPDVVIQVVTGRDELRAALKQGTQDLVISAYRLTGFDGMEALQLVREFAPELPVIFVSDTLGEEQAIEAVRAGAVDYVIKDRLQRLRLSVQRVLREAAEKRAQRRLEAASAQEQNLLRVLLENLPDHVYFKDTNSRFIAVSRSLAHRHGREPAELRGRTDADLFSREHAEKAAVDEQRIMATGEPILEQEEKETLPDGSVSWVSTTKLPMRDASGRIVGTFGVSRDISERKRRDEALRLFRTLVDRSNDAFEVIDPATTRFLDVNERECTTLGYTREEMLGLHLGDIDPAVTPAMWSDYLASIRATGTSSLEAQHRRKDGTLFPVEINARLVRLDREYLVVVVRDITERKKAEARMRLLSSALASTVNAIVITNIKGLIEWTNPAFTRLTGYSAAEAEGRNPSALVKSGQHEATFYEGLWGTILAGKVWQGEMINRRKDGTLYDEFQTITPVRDEADRISHFIAIKEDISERRRAEQQLREQAEILDHAPLAILITDLGHRITYCNNGAVQLYDSPRERLLGATAEEILTGEAVPLLAAARAAALSDGHWTGEIPLLMRSGQHRQVEFHMFLIRDAAGRPQARLSIGIDVTDKKSLEEQFLRAQRLESLGMLAAGIAHDLNNVLAPVLMGAPLLRSRSTNPGDVRILEMIENSASRGAALVRQILSFAHGVGGNKVVIQPKHLLRDITGLIEQTFPKNITLQEEVVRDLWTVQGNPTQLHQVLLNLCVNARDAMPQGGTLRLKATNQVLDATQAGSDATPGHYVAIEVGDTGTGILPEITERIWDPFFTTKDKGKGTGLGLATVRGIVMNHGGLITLDTHCPGGSVFRVFLPAAEPQAGGPAAGSTHPFAARGKGELILVVDDEESIRDLIKAVLSRSGYRVLVAANGLDGMSLYVARAAEIALVVTDLSMPGMGGEELAVALTKLNPAVKLLFMSGAGAVPPAKDQPVQGVPVLMKPFVVDQLVSLVRDALETGPVT